MKKNLLQTFDEIIIPPISISSNEMTADSHSKESPISDDEARLSEISVPVFNTQ